jgi:hypothetical protein
MMSLLCEYQSHLPVQGQWTRLHRAENSNEEGEVILLPL